MSEINSLQQQLSMKSAELEALKKSYSSTHQQLQTTSSEIQSAKKRAQSVQETTQSKMNEVEQTLQRIRQTLDTTGRESHSHAMLIQEDIAKIHEALTALSADFFDHKRLTLQVQNKLTSQVSLLEESKRRALDVQRQVGGGGSFTPPQQGS